MAYGGGHRNREILNRLSRKRSSGLWRSHGSSGVPSRLSQELSSAHGRYTREAFCTFTRFFFCVPHHTTTIHTHTHTTTTTTTSTTPPPPYNQLFARGLGIDIKIGVHLHVERVNLFQKPLLQVRSSLSRRKCVKFVQKPPLTVWSEGLPDTRSS